MNMYILFSDYGHLFMFGSNRFGQLGVGDYKARTGVTMLSDH